MLNIAIAAVLASTTFYHVRRGAMGPWAALFFTGIAALNFGYGIAVVFLK